jgi:hypothetical protein
VSYLNAKISIKGSSCKEFSNEILIETLTKKGAAVYEIALQNK